MTIDVIALGRFMARFSYEDLSAVCFDLVSGLDELYLQGKKEFSQALVLRMGRAGRLDDFMAIVEKQRPDLDWSEVTRQSFQDRMVYNHCWGCGPTNDQGLQIKSYWQGEEAVSFYYPKSQQKAGPEHLLNGGIIATIIDCHCVCTAIADAYRRQDREIGTLPIIWYATASLKVDYLQPTPIEGPVKLRARIKSSTERKTIMTCDVTFQDKVRASAELVAVRVPESWLELS
jgi:acyl-coenzyme A thioesterase PaaI-like protein